jgi:hypothetical protein
MVGGAKPWMCAVKLMGHKRGPRSPSHEGDPEDEPTQTLLLRTGRGISPEDAQRDALAQITQPVPQPIIHHKPSTPPPPKPRPSWLSRLAAFFTR